MNIARTLIARGYWKEADDDGSDLGGSGVDDETKDAPKSEDDKATKSESDSDDKSSDGDKDDSYEREKATLLADVMKKKKRIANLTEELQGLQERAKAWEGIDVDDVRKLMKERQDAETAKLEAKGEWDKLKAQMNDHHAKELDGLRSAMSQKDEEVNALRSTVEKLTLGHAFDSSKFINGELSLTTSKARLVYGSHFDIEDGKVVGYDKPRGESGRVQLVDGSGNPLQFEAALRKIVDSDPDRDNLLLSKMRAGAASKTEGRSTPKDNKPKAKGLQRIQGALESSN